MGGKAHPVQQAQAPGQFEVQIVLDFRAGLRPDLADVAEIGNLVPHLGQRLHDLPPPLGGGVPAHRENQQLPGLEAQDLPHGQHLGIILGARHEGVRVASDRQHHHAVPADAVADEGLLHPVSGHQDQLQRVQFPPEVGHVAIGQEPGHGRHAEALGVEDEVGIVAPEPHAHHRVGLEPAVLPLLFQAGAQVGRPGLDPHLEQPPVQEIALGGKAAGRGRIIVQNQDFHDGSALGQGTGRKASERGVVRVSQLVSA